MSFYFHSLVIVLKIWIHRIDSGSYLSNPEMIAIRFQVEPERYESAIKWLKDLLWDGIFDLNVSLRLNRD